MQDLETAQVIMTRRADKKAVVHLHMKYLLAIKKEENLTLCNIMDGPRGHYAK